MRGGRYFRISKIIAKYLNTPCKILCFLLFFAVDKMRRFRYNDFTIMNAYATDGFCEITQRERKHYNADRLGKSVHEVF